MLEKIKIRLSEILFSKQTRVKCIAVLTAVTVAVVSLLGLSINTVNVFDGEKNYVVRYYLCNRNSAALYTYYTKIFGAAVSFKYLVGYSFKRAVYSRLVHKRGFEFFHKSVYLPKTKKSPARGRAL